MNDLETYQSLKHKAADLRQYSATLNDTSIFVCFHGSDGPLAAADLIRRWLTWNARKSINWTEFGFVHLNKDTGRAVDMAEFGAMSEDDGTVNDGWYLSKVAPWILHLTGSVYTVFARRQYMYD